MLLVAFVVIERARPSPMFDLSLFRKPTFVGASIAAFTLSASMFAMFLYLTLYLQTLLGYVAAADRAALPAVTADLVLRGGGRRASSRARSRCAGCSAAGWCSSASALLLMHGVTADSHWTALLAGLHPRRAPASG